MIIHIISLPAPVDSILEAVFTVSPNKQYLGIVRPTTPATAGPEKHSGIFCIFRSQWPIGLSSNLPWN
jgi:hypothetical protein